MYIRHVVYLALRYLKHENDLTNKEKYLIWSNIHVKYNGMHESDHECDGLQ